MPRSDSWLRPTGRPEHGFRAAVVILSFVLTACSSPNEPATTGITSQSNPKLEEITRAMSGRGDGALEQEPVLRLTRVCYDICPHIRDMPEFAVYSDGTLVAIDRLEAGDPWRINSFRLSASDLDRLAELMLAGGLDTGDIHAAGTRGDVADGGGTVYETAIGPRHTYVHAPLLYSLEGEPVRE